jgi:3-isopropylmalate/(R)-2-methylmalate dehydratase small subunit
MQQFQIIKSKIIPLLQNDIDTDQIIPARYLKATDKNGMADGLFAGWRYLASGENNPEFPLNQPIYQGSEILLAGDNFGCGSSREHAPWALLQWGIRAIISTSFADIFRNNAYKNGLLPIEVNPATHQRISNSISADPNCLMIIDLPAQKIKLSDGYSDEFEIDPFSKNSLVNGIDQLGYLLQFSDKIDNFENELESTGIYRITTTVEISSE